MMETTALVQHCQFKQGKQRCGRVAAVWVKRSWIGGYNEVEHEQTIAACMGHADGLQVIEPVRIEAKYEQQW